MYNEIKLKKVKISSLDSCGVYVIKNISNGKNYVGQSKNVLRRVNNHLNGKDNGDVYADFKYGDDIKIFVIRCSIYELNFYEKNLIKKYDSYNNGYNKNRGNNF